MKLLLVGLALAFSSLANAAPNVVATYSLLTRPSITTGWGTVVNFETPIVDSHGAVSLEPSWRLTVPARAGGNYFVTFYLQWVGPISSASFVYLRKNGEVFRALARADDTTGSLGLNGGTVIPLVPGDWIDILVFQVSGAPKEISAGHISVFRLHGSN